MSLRLVLFIYNLVFPIALLFLLPGYLLKIFRRGNYSNSFGERFGIYSSEKKEKLVVRLREEGESLRGIREQTGLAVATVRRIIADAEQAKVGIQ